MMTLVVTLCLLSDPTHCRDLKIPMAEAHTPQQCMMMAQGVLAENTDSHTEQTKRLTCKAS